MELFIDQEQYVANLATEAGVKVVIHDRGSMPFPEDAGMSIIPGRSTSIGLRKVSHSHRDIRFGPNSQNVLTSDLKKS